MGLRVTDMGHLQNCHIDWNAMSDKQYRTWEYIHNCMNAAGFKIAAKHMAQIVHVVNNPKALRALERAWQRYAGRKEP
jgi:hypothetical protein